MTDLRSEDSEGIKLCIHERYEPAEERADSRWRDVALLQEQRADELEYYLRDAQKKLKDLEQKYKGDMQFVLRLFKKHVPDVIFDEYNQTETLAYSIILNVLIYNLLYFLLKKKLFKNK